MYISIIIPTLNRSLSLKKLLTSISESYFTKKKIEFIIIDNGSTDNTEKVVSDFVKTNQEIKVLYQVEPEPGLLSGRHLGAKLASGDILTFIDDDVYLPPLWVSNIDEIVNQYPDFNLFTGSNLPFYESYPPEWLDYFWDRTPYGGRMCTWLSLLDLGTENIEIHPNYAFGLNFTIRRKAFEDLDGFHPDSTPECFQHFQGDGETGLTRKAFKKGYKALYSSKLMLYHQVPSSRMTTAYFSKRAFFQGIADSFTKCRDMEGTYEEEHFAHVNLSYIYLKALKIYRKFFKQKNPNKLAIPSHVNDIKKMVDLEYKRGFNFHQKVFHENELVRNWVLRDNYFDYKLPE